MSSDPLVNMWISFIGMALMFAAVILTIFTKEKLSGLLRYILLTICFLLIVIAGFIVFITVFAGPTIE